VAVRLRRLGLIGILALGTLGAPLSAEAQPAGKIYRIGMLEMASPALNAANLDAFRQGLRELGYVEGQNLAIEYRSADGRFERLPALATELVRLKVDLIVTRATSGALAAKAATKTTPIVMAGAGDPVGAGVVAGLASPGANVTGLSAVIPELTGKRVELLRELVPRATRIAAMLDMRTAVSQPVWNQIETAARALGMQPQLVDVRKAEDLGRAFETAVQQRAEALFVAEIIMQANRRPIVDLAAKHRLPTIYASRESVDVGGLMSYGPNISDLYRRAASFADKIFKGARPGDLPVEQPTKFELAINLRTARALGLAVPQSLMLRADHVIQ